MIISKSKLPSRRAAITFLVSAGFVVSGAKLRAETQPVVTVYKDPSCGCCSGWARHMTAAGFTVTVIETTNVDVVKARLGVPDKLASCHTAEISGFAIEGHVPAPTIMRLLSEKPAAKGLAVPGMPAGAPGMDGSSREIYEVILFGDDGEKIFARYHNAQQI
jgi:hypothetical protein